MTGQNKSCEVCGKLFPTVHGASVHRATAHEDEEVEAVMLEELRELAEELGRTPYAKEMEEDGPFSTNTYQNRFGSWNAALELAGLEPNRVWGGVEVKCWYCGERFRKKYSHAQLHDQHFCDAGCMGEWESEHYCGEDNPRWAGGYDDYYGETWEAARRAAIKSDDSRCQACGRTREAHREEFNTDIAFHHIQPIRTFEDPNEANSLDNLVTLCCRCHKRWEGVPIRPSLAD